MPNTTNLDKGSGWKKWDLHVHTPNSIVQGFGTNDNETWEKYIKDLEALPEEFAVIGINDYLFLDGYSRLKFEQDTNSRLPKLKLLPVVEFRITQFAGVDFGPLKRINLHVIFSDELQIETIQSQFLNTLEQSYYLETNQPWTRAITRQSVEELGKEIKSKVPPTELHKFRSDILEGFNNLNVNEDSIFKSLNKDCFSGKYIIAVGKTEWGQLKWTDGSIATKKHIINRADIVFTASTNPTEFFKAKQSLISQSVNNLLLDCSDAHYYSTDTNKDRIGNSFTWIKADPTFEGLKQILFEPKHRIIVSEHKPREPIRKLEGIKFNFPTNTFIKRNSSNDKQPLCLNQLSTEITFSPYFTCLIGGRGTGKSTIINLLGERLGEQTDFFADNTLLVDTHKYDIEGDLGNLIIISGTKEIEFVSQGKIERLAEGEELTKLVFNERIKEIEGGFYTLDNQIDSVIETINDTITLLFDISNLNTQLKDKEKEKEIAQNIIDSVNEERYKDITFNINEIQKEINVLVTSHSRYEALLKSVRGLLITHTSIKAENDYELRINAILDSIKSIDEISLQGNEVQFQLKQFRTAEIRFEELKAKFSAENKRLKEFFQEKGMSEDTIKDSQKANESISRINSEIEQLLMKRERCNELLKENNKKIENLTTLYTSYNQLIGINLEQINQKLDINNENVLNINFRSEFNTEELKRIIFEEFYAVFEEYHIPGTSQNYVKDVLFSIEPDEALLSYAYTDFIGMLDTKISSRFGKTSNYVKTITDIFASNFNYSIYQLIVKKNLYNLSRFTRIKGFYGERELQNCSFGQRCTAVIVTLLMTGIKPLVIDEPEAHLDNRLIADYLVEILKSKKLDRQIVFATHNSNFVINGDAELIHILEIPLGALFTNVTSTSIENTTNREKLLKLEGGRDAFLMREQKYGIHR